MRCWITLAVLSVVVSVLFVAGPAQADQLRDQPALRASSVIDDRLVGANVPSWWHEEFLYPVSDAALAELAASGANTAMLVVTRYMTSCTSSDIIANDWTATDTSLEHAIATAKASGLTVGLKLHIDVLDDRCGRHSIQPRDRSAWHRHYAEIVLHYATLAQQHEVDLIVIGTELDSLSIDSLAWRLLIRNVRASFDGELTYAANPEEFALIQFWDALDYIGIDAYFELTTALNPSTAALRRGWERYRDPGTREFVSWKAQIEAVQRQFAKPVLFTEAGYRSIEGAAITPASCEHTGREDLDQQARAYRALFDVWGDEPYWAGVLFWAWLPDPLNQGCTSEFSPQDKPAAAEITRYMASQ